MLTRTRYLRLSTVLPIIVPILLFAGTALSEIFGLKVPRWVDFSVGMSFSAVFMFGIPYCILICALLLFLWDRSWKVYVVAALTAPVLMIPVVGVFLWALSGKNPMTSALELAPYCAAVGYAYLGITFAGMWVLIGMNIIKD